MLALLQVDLSGLLVGGAVTAVVLGIAAQQTLGNFFAGLVLLFARPYIPGQRVTIHNGAMGGPFDGVITGAGLTYTTKPAGAGGTVGAGDVPAPGGYRRGVGSEPDRARPPVGNRTSPPTAGGRSAGAGARTRAPPGTHPRPRRCFPWPPPARWFGRVWR